MSKRKKSSQNKKRKQSTGNLKATPRKASRKELQIGFDEMASLLERIVRPRLPEARIAAAKIWSITLDGWASSEERLSGHDTERLERLIDQAWIACKNAVCKWDPRFALQAIRSLPSEVIDAIGQLALDPSAVTAVIRLSTSAAIQSNGVTWPKIDETRKTSIEITSEQWDAILDQAPQVLGECVGAATLVYFAQTWYRSAGKGKKIVNMPQRLEPKNIEALNSWTGDGIMILPALEMNSDPAIDKAILIYETRKDIEAQYNIRSGLLLEEESLVDSIDQSMWFAGWRNIMNRAIPVHVPQMNRIFPSPNWYPSIDPNLHSWIEQLRPFDDGLQIHLGLTCDQLELGLRALGLVIARQTQCCYLKLVTIDNREMLVLDSPGQGRDLDNAVLHLVSILIRGTLRTSVHEFRTAIQNELIGLGWTDDPEHLAEIFLNALTGLILPTGLPNPFLFHILDPLTCVLDLSLWHDFKDACLSIASSGDGDLGNRRGQLFEEQIRERLKRELELTKDDLPWPANSEVWEGKINRGDVDFCFIRHNILFNLDMKSWQRSSSYHIGHYHTIQERLKTLEKQMKQLESRGLALQYKLKQLGSKFAERLDFLVVASPEYLAVDRPLLWYGDQPRVITLKELIHLAKTPEMLYKITSVQETRE